RPNRLDAMDVAFAQVGRLERVRRRGVQIREGGLERLWRPADEPEAVAGKRRDVDVGRLDSPLGGRADARGLELEPTLLERDEVARGICHQSISSAGCPAGSTGVVSQGRTSGLATIASTTRRCASSYTGI